MTKLRNKFAVITRGSSGIGLANIRERLQLLYGNKATLTIGENAPSGTTVTITVPYQAQTQGNDAGASA